MQKSDVFNEQLVSRKQNKMDTIKKVGIIIGGLVLIVLSSAIKILATFLLPLVVIIIVVELYLLRRFNIEYEYTFTNGDLDIDKIINKSKRKHVLTISVNDILVMVPVNNSDYAKEVEDYTKLYDFSSGTVKENTYAAIIRSGTDGKIKFIIEPNEKMFKAIRSYIPRKIRK